jgi:hypothetical protein
MTTRERWILWSAVAAAIMVLHSMFEFFAWATYPGNMAPGSHGSAIPWEIASFPLFLFVGHAAGLNSFWLELVANSVIWSVVLTFVAKRIFGGK